MFTYDTPFSAMPAGYRESWIKWANSHDWGGDKLAHFEGENLVTYGQAHNGTEWSVERAAHKTPRDMRNWAGY